jgi:hypothetical protein
MAVKVDDGPAGICVHVPHVAETVRRGRDCFEAIVEELAAALVADFMGDAAATVGSPSGMDHER